MTLLDGELPVSHARRVEAHLAGCPECSEILRRYQAVSASFSSERLFPSPPAEQPGMRDAPPPVPLSTPHPRKIFQPGWAASIALMLSAAVLWQTIVAPPGVSARDLIERARIEEQRPLMQVSEPVVHRKLRSTRKVAGVVQEQTEHEETWKGAPGRVSQASATSAIADEIGTAISPHGCSQYAPLSVSMMECLASRDSALLRIVEPPSELEGRAYQLAMDLLNPSQGTPFSCTWTLRTADWRLTRVDFRFFRPPSDVEYGVEELSYRIVDAVSLAKSPASESRTATVEQPARPEPPAWNPGPHIARKLAVLQVLTDLGLSPEDEIQFHWGGKDAPAAVDVLTASEERKQYIQAALERVEGVLLSVRTYDEVAAEALAGDLDSGGQPDAPAATPRMARTFQSEGPLLLETMTERFGGGEQGREHAIAFGGSILETTQFLMFQTKWLERVRQTIPAEDRLLLSADQARQLGALEDRLATEIARVHTQLNERAHMVLCPSYCPADGAPEAREEAGDTPPGGDRSESLAAAMDYEFALLKVLFVDRAFQAQGSVDGTAMEATDAASRWKEASAAVSRAFLDIATHEKPAVARMTQAGH